VNRSPHMRIRHTLAALAIALSLSSATYAARISPEDQARILPVARVHAGMRGYALTVFHGDRIEKFDIKVLGVLPKMNSGRPLILVRAGGGLLSKRPINIAEGMSGSPVYIGGKIIGAVAYTGEFSKEPLALVTPIEDMLALWDGRLPADAPGAIPHSGSNAAQVSESNFNIHIPAMESAAATTFHPIAVPLTASGFGPDSLAEISRGLARLPVSVRSGPGRMEPSRNIPLKEGSSVAFSLVTGDAEMSAIGTVTYRRGNRVLAFGHKFLSAGPLCAPMSTVWVHDVFPSYQASYKLASPVAEVGASGQDRPVGMSGALGAARSMIPMDITVQDDSGTPLRFHADIVNHPLFTPMLARAVATEALARKRPYSGEAEAKVTVDISADGIGEITRSNTFFSAADIRPGALSEFDTLLSLLQDNRFHPVPLKRISLDVRFYQKRETAEIERVFLDRSVYRPGEMIRAVAQIRPFRQEPVLCTIEVQVPGNAQDGSAALSIQGGGETSSGSQVMLGGIAIPLRPSLPDEIRDAGSIRQMLDRFSVQTTNDQIVARLILPTASFRVNGDKLDGLSPVMEQMMVSSRASGTRLARDEVKVRQQTDWVVSGSHVLSVTIQKKNLLETAAAKAETETAKEKTTTSATTTTGTLSGKTASPTSTPLRSVSTDEDEDDGGSVEIIENDPSSDETADADTAEAADTASPAGETIKDTSTTADKAKTGTDTTAKGADKTTKVTETFTTGRIVKTWRQTSMSDFSKGDAVGVAAYSAGGICPGWDIGRQAGLDELYIWALCPGPRDTVFAATGNSGAVYRVYPDGKAEKLFSVDGSQASCLTRDGAGRLWAGACPGGGIWMLESGKARKVAQIPAQQVSALAACPGQSAVYAAAGDSGRIWRVDSSGNVQEVANTGQTQVQCLLAAEDGTLYAGTSGEAAVWRIRDGRAEPFYRASEDFVASLALDGQGRCYASCGPRGKVYRIEDGKSPVTVLDKLTAAVTPIAATRSGNIAVWDSRRFCEILEDGTYRATSQEQALDAAALTAMPDGTFRLAACNTASVWSIAPAAKAAFESAVHDAGRPAAWGRMTLSPTPQNVRAFVRAGGVETPDASWSAWREVAPGDSPAGLTGRYAQYRLEMADAKPETIGEVSLSYLPANQPPTVKFTKPTAGTAWKGSQDVRWSGSDPDSDRLSYQLFVSSDGGAQWKPLAGVTAQSAPEKPADAADAKKPGELTAEPSVPEPAQPVLGFTKEQMLAQIAAQLKAHPEIPEDVRRQMLEASPAMLDKAEQHEKEWLAGKKTSGSSLTTTTYHWDTSKVQDGIYWLKVTATDELTSGSGALTAEATCGPVRVANTPPTVRIFSDAPKHEESGALVWEGAARSKSAAIVAVQYRVDEKGEWATAEPADGIFDSPDETFNIRVKGLSGGSHKLEVRAKDEAGNQASEKLMTALLPAT